MSKDPAFLFYTSDFLVGVSDLTMEERGQYITLMCLQHTKGHLSAKNIKIAVGDVSPDVLAKFLVDSDGLYYNERLEQEIIKRQQYCEKQANNIKKRWEKQKSENDTTVHTVVLPTNVPSENENENINDNNNNNNSKFKLLSFIPTLDDVKEYARSRDRLDLATAFFEYYEAGKWHDKDGKPVKCWKQKFITWCNKNVKPVIREGYVADYTKDFEGVF